MSFTEQIECHMRHCVVYAKLKCITFAPFFLALNELTGFLANRYPFCSHVYRFR